MNHTLTQALGLIDRFIVVWKAFNRPKFPQDPGSNCLAMHLAQIRAKSNRVSPLRRFCRASSTRFSPRRPTLTLFANAIPAA
jgi:hypothetical protein